MIPYCIFDLPTLSLRVFLSVNRLSNPVENFTKPGKSISAEAGCLPGQGRRTLLKKRPF
jgi:hypothetical protein